MAAQKESRNRFGELVEELARSSAQPDGARVKVIIAMDKTIDSSQVRKA